VGRLFRVAAFALAACAIAACASSGPRLTQLTTTTTAAQAGGTTATTGTRSGDCPPAAAVVPVHGPSAKLARMGTAGGVSVDAAVYPHPDHDGNPWSQWGQGVVLPDGRFVTAIGDENTPDGNSYLYELDPGTGTLTQTADVASVAGGVDGDTGYGKIHAALRLDPCGTVYATTYWGSARKVDYTPTYTGDVLLKYDPAAHKLTKVAVPLPGHGLPSLSAWFPGRLLYAEAPEPTATEKTGSFIAWDLAAGKVAFEDHDAAHALFRNVLVGADGTAYIAAEPGKLNAFDPKAMKLRTDALSIPGGNLRASTLPAPDGTVYGVTQKPEELFALRSTGKVDDLGPAQGYTASLALDPTGRHLYYVPGAHGGTDADSSVVVEVDTATHTQRDVVNLGDLLDAKLQLQIGGSYDIAIDPTGRTLYVGLNAGEPGGKNTFGTVVLAVVHLP
jgi:hypothetical protein